LSLIITTKGSNFIITCHKQPEENPYPILIQQKVAPDNSWHLFQYEHSTKLKKSD